jgi:hypothetical protein
MRQIPGHYPANAIRRIRQQAPTVGPMQSCQSEVLFFPLNYLIVKDFIDGVGGQDAQAVIRDANMILPYSTLTFQFCADGPKPADTPYLCNLLIINTHTTFLITAAAIAYQINEWVRAFKPTVRNLNGMYARINGTNPNIGVKLYLPWGMLGNRLDTNLSVPMFPDNTWYGTDFPGVDNPLVFGQIGPRKHVFAVHYPFEDLYYGDAPSPIP